MTPILRRDLLRALAAAPTSLTLASRAAAGQTVSNGVEDTIGAALSPWRPGGLDIHHIATGQGDASLIIAPDGTSLLVDAGATASRPPLALPIMPGPARRAGEWIARYAARRLADTGRPGLDYLLITHIHPDHMGDVLPDSPMAAVGGYRLTGVADVAARLPIGLILDRGFPDYAYPAAQTQPWALNYMAFIRARVAMGGRVERFRPGAGDQIRPLWSRSPAPAWSVRNLAVNGQVWGGRDEATTALFPPVASLPADSLPDENMCSAAFRLRYGAFGYFAAGDLSSNTFDGDQPWRDVLTPAARVGGPVDVAVAPTMASPMDLAPTRCAPCGRVCGSATSGTPLIRASPHWSGCSASGSIPGRARFSPPVSPPPTPWSTIAWLAGWPAPRVT